MDPERIHQSAAPPLSGPTMTAKPSPALYFKGTGTRLLIVMPLALVGLMFGYRSRELTINERVLLAVGILALVGLIMICLLAVPRISVAPSELRVRNPLGITRRYRREELSFAVLAERYQASPQVASKPMLLVAATGNRSAALLNGHYWTEESMDGVLRNLNLARVDVIQAPLTPIMFDRHYPQLLPFIQRRPLTFAGIIALAIALLIVGAIVVTH
jgi:hypothetical protein